MSYKAIAVQIGDILKWDVPINTINRNATATFNFECQNFTNDAITSERAQTIYNWILSLATRQMNNDERDELLAQFCSNITPEEHKDEINQILLDNGIAPNVVNRELYEAFVSRNFHPSIYQHSRDLFIQGNFFHAVFEAAKAYNYDVKNKSQSEDDGQTLMMNVWGCDGVLKITPCETETDRNVQDGVKFLSSGLMRAIRNPTAHEPAILWPISQQDCLDILSFISFLLRNLDNAQYYHGP
ncbi:TIGR02391 family protein [Rhodohalobacter sp. 614A]|uniref:TIGR02391 family protein n=1 Tax=Rhodohalobacter sp. 614A TaxID=2908649 RepID=UPI001F3CB8FD|nr:TIGR02391 family protein [Rhodohalobacter sp. 614A]